MYITTVYSKLTTNQQKKIKSFLKHNFNESNNNFELEEYTIIVIDMLDNKIIGCVCLYDNKFLLDKINVNNISTDYFTLNNAHGCFIYNLCVDKEYRNRKIGYNMINHVLQKMGEINIKYLHTQAENDIARILFLKCGFIEDNQFIGSNHKKVYVMSKYI